MDDLVVVRVRPEAGGRRSERERKGGKRVEEGRQRLKKGGVEEIGKILT